ncbi:MAG: TetR/AcrR family transcriptional regulator [Gemmatimonadetes bacterium]|nr:TetR/AcrR family transcriptional regulator [Gemmatimonadota bacterium]
MNDRTGARSARAAGKEPTTREALLEAGRELFAAAGYHATSIRSITGSAGANLGAVTYHFGSKEGLYHAVLENALAPFRRVVRVAAESRTAPLEGIEAFLRAFFQHLLDHPELRALMLEQLASEGPLPEPVKRTFRSNFGLLRKLIEAGQEEGTICGGDPRLLAVAVAAQPAVLNLLRPVLEQAGGISTASREDREVIIENAIRFVRAGLGAPGPSSDREAVR